MTRTAPLVALLLLIASTIVGVVLRGRSVDTLPDRILNPDSQPTAIPQVDIGYHLSRGDKQAALYHVQNQAAIEGWSEGLHRQAANLWTSMGSVDRAIPHYEAIIELTASVDSLRQLASIYLQRSDFTQAYDYIESVLRLAPDDTWSLYHAGVLLAPTNSTQSRNYLTRVMMQDSPYATQAQQLVNAIGLDDTDWLISSRVGLVLANQQQWHLAEYAFESASAAYYPYAAGMAYVALMRAQQGLDGAIWMAAALQADPFNPSVLFINGIYLRLLGQYEASEQALLYAITLSPNNPILLVELANTYRVMGDLGEAETWLQTARAMDADHPAVAQAMNRLDNDIAFLVPPDLIAATSESGENDPNVLAARGWALHLTGESDEGLALIEIALTIEPANPRARFDKARIIHEQGDHQQAREILQTLEDEPHAFATLATRLLRDIP